MGEVTVKVTGLLPKISSLFDNHIFSDVKFVFMCDNRKMKNIYGHKLILSLRSEVFASMFFNTKESPSEVILPASKISSFSHLLRFLYTDDIQFHAFEEARELYELANEFAVEELSEKCSGYILHETLTTENILPKYEYALSRNMCMLLKDCQDFVCSNTQLVLESVHFTNASVKVVEDIVKQDNLSVSSELEIIVSILKWGSEELKRKKILPEEKLLRECINPFMKYLRFLTLSFSEFDYFIENFNIFTGYESSILTRKIYQPQCIVDFPESLCSVTTKRTKKCDSKSMPVVTTVQNTFCGSFPEDKSPDLPSLPASFTNNTSYDSLSKIPPPASFNSTDISLISDSKPKISNPLCSSDYESPMTSVNKVSYHIKKYSPFKGSNVSQSEFISSVKQTKFCSAPNIVDKKYFPPTVMHSNRVREFEFPLLESQPCLGTSFLKDVKSTVYFKMRTGNINLYGLELKVKNDNNRAMEEELEIDVDLRGFSKQPFSHQFKKKLKENVLTLRFPEKMVLQEGSKGLLDVSIDNLLLKRCSICDINDKGYKLNIGLNFACEISLNSTQKIGNNHIFLISKLIYVPY